jgi:membrane-associated phospholipid phosphatase
MTQLSRDGLWLAGRRAGVVVALVAAVLAVGVLRLKAREAGYVAGFAGGAVALYFARGYFARRPGHQSDVRWWGAYVLGFLAFAYLRTLADETGIAWQYGYVIDLEELLGAGAVPTVWMQQHWFTAGSRSPFDLLMFGVYISYFVAPQLAGILVWRAHRGRFRVYVAASLATFALGLLISFVLPTAPPWLAGQEGRLPEVYRVIVEVTADAETTAREIGYSVASSNPVGAMPSLHMAVTMVVALAAAQHGRALAAGGALYATAMALALVYLGEHYAVDLIAGIVVAVGAWAFASRRFSDDRAQPSRE